MQAGQNRRAESPAGKEESAVSDLTIIGGADGPTAIYAATRPLDWLLLGAVLLVVIGGAVTLVKRWKRRK